MGRAQLAHRLVVALEADVGDDARIRSAGAREEDSQRRHALELGDPADALTDVYGAGRLSQGRVAMRIGYRGRTAWNSQLRR